MPGDCKILPLREAALFVREASAQSSQGVHEHAEAQVTWRMPATYGGALPATSILPPWTPHQNGDGLSVVLHLGTSLVEQAADELLGTAAVELAVDSAVDSALAHLGTTVFGELQHAWRNSLFLDAWTYVVAGHVVRRYARPLRSTSMRPQHAERLTAAQLGVLRQLLERRLERPPHVGEMAAAVGLRPHRFMQLLRRSTNLGPHGYVTELRVERARRLLTDSTRPLAEIGLALGFCSQSHFTAVFRQHVGTTPGAYRLDATRDTPSRARST